MSERRLIGNWTYMREYLFGKYYVSQADGKQLSDPSDAVHLVSIQRVEIAMFFLPANPAAYNL
jgi:hypothetical protein